MLKAKLLAQLNDSSAILMLVCFNWNLIYMSKYSVVNNISSYVLILAIPSTQVLAEILHIFGHQCNIIAEPRVVKEKDEDEYPRSILI